MWRMKAKGCEVGGQTELRRAIPIKKQKLHREPVSVGLLQGAP